MASPSPTPRPTLPGESPKSLQGPELLRTLHAMRGHRRTVCVHWTEAGLRALRTGQLRLDFERRNQLLSALTKCPKCWQIARRRVEAEVWPDTLDVVLRALCRSTSLRPTARQQRALARPLGFFHLVLEELRDLMAEPVLDEGYLRPTVMSLDLFLASLDGEGAEGLRDAEIGVHLLSAEFWAVRGRLGRAKEELSDAEFCWRHGGRDPLLEAEIVLLQTWIRRLESTHDGLAERRLRVGLDR